MELSKAQLNKRLASMSEVVPLPSQDAQARLLVVLSIAAISNNPIWSNRVWMLRKRNSEFASSPPPDADQSESFIEELDEIVWRPIYQSKSGT
jgi:hypothetical protein